jgi:hypothetical protein
MEFPKDDFLVVTTDGPDDDKLVSAIMDEIHAIAGRYGGGLDECGAIEGAPFEELFEQRPRSH